MFVSGNRGGRGYTLLAEVSIVVEKDVRTLAAKPLERVLEQNEHKWWIECESENLQVYLKYSKHLQ